MRQRRLLMWSVVAAVFTWPLSAVEAQPPGYAGSGPGYFGGYQSPYGPTYSPYLNFFRKDPGPINPYLSFVRPQFQLLQSQRRQNAEIQGLQNQVYSPGAGGSSLAPSGTGSDFMTHDRYFRTRGGFSTRGRN